MTLKRTSIILCTYNEANYIENTISELEKNIPNLEIVIVDDASTDGTAEIIRKGDMLGTLKVGAEGDAAIIQVVEGSFPLVDRLGTATTFHDLKWEAPVQVEATRKLKHILTIRGGKTYRPWIN